MVKSTPLYRYKHLVNILYFICTYSICGRIDGDGDILHFNVSDNSLLSRFVARGYDSYVLVYKAGLCSVK